MDLIGGYTMVSGEKHGQAIPAERIEGTTVRFTRDSIVVVTPDKQEAYASTFELDTTASPCKITMTSKLAPNEGEVAQGLIDKQGDTVRLIYSLPGTEPPTEFRTRQGQLLFVMENRNK